MIAPASTHTGRRFWLANSLWLLIGRGGSQALALLLTIIVARSLGDVGLGQFTVVLTVVFIGNVFSTFGLDTLLIRSVARELENAQISAVFSIQTALSLLFIAGVWLLAPAGTLGWGMRIYSLSLIPLAATTVFNAILRGQERMNIYTTLQLFAAGCRLATVAGLLFLNVGFLPIIWALLACQILEAVTTGWATFNLQLSAFNLQLSTLDLLLPTLKASLALAGLTLFAILYQRIAIIILAWFDDAGMTGQFSAAMRLVDIPRMVPYALAGALFPSMARTNGQRGTDNEQRTIRPRTVLPHTEHWFIALGLGSAGLAVASWPLADWATRLLFGNGYAAAAGVLPILAWTLIPFVAVLYGSFVLVARNQERQVMLAHGLALALAAGLGSASLARWGLQGLAGALIIAETIHAVILFWLAHRGTHAPS